jgi:hypothetical protein
LEISAAGVGDAGLPLNRAIPETSHEITFQPNLYATRQLCIDKSDGTPVCITGDQLAGVGQTNTSQLGQGSAGAVSGVSATSTPDTPPIIQVNGDNPATINVGDTYNDLGAIITGPAADLNLGIHTFVGDPPIDQAEIDTSTTTTYHINYVATDAAGLTATSTRTVIIQAAATTSH